MNKLELIQTFEPIFIEAANLAASLKEKATSANKYQSGVSAIDIVTSADLEVQEFILNKLADSDLKNCELVAEEDTPSRKRFAKSSELVLTLDPIDGTKFYSEGKNGYSLIVSIHDKKRPIYTFNYFPELHWGIKIVNNAVTELGQKPHFDLEALPKTIIYSNYGQTDPKNIPDLYARLSKRGYQFLEGKSRRAIVCDNAQLFLGLIDGIYVENDSAVDCLVSLHFALANDYEIYQNIDITKPVVSTLGGDEYRGYYLAIRR